MASSGAKVAGSSSPSFRAYLPDLSTPRFTTMHTQDIYSYTRDFFTHRRPPWLHALYQHWRRLFTEPFKGVTVDGHVRPNLFPVRDEGLDIEPLVAAARAFLTEMTPDQRKRVEYHVDSPEWRSWSNPEFLMSDKGVRLDEVSQGVRERALGLLRASTSAEGYGKALAAMRINGFLGQLVKGEKVMNEFSYNVVVFGEPSATRPWGWALYGHHLCLNMFLYRGQIVISPCFTGAEPNVVDDGPYKGTRILEKEEELGLRLMQSLPDGVKAKARVYELMNDPKMPEGRWNKDDQRHLCGAYRDNRIIPYEGLLVSEMTTVQQDLVWQIAEQYLLYLPEKPRSFKLQQVKEHVAETYFCWIGGFGDEDPFYFRVQSPVIVAEFDHHSGVFLTNQEPAKFHIHTILRTPNAGDYGMALRPQIPSAEDKFVAVL